MEDEGWYTTSELMQAAQLGNYDILLHAVSMSKRVSPSLTDKDGVSLLHYAAAENRNAVGSMLIKTGADMDLQDGIKGETPLHWAVRNKHFRFLEMMITRGADINAKSLHDGFTALHIACSMGDLRLIIFLLFYDADPNIQDRKGNTPLLWLVKYYARLQYLQENGTISIDNYENTYQLIHQIIDLLLYAGADASIPDSLHTNTALHIIAWQSSFNSILTFKIYLSGKQSVKTMNIAGKTPLQVCMEMKHIRMKVKFSFEFQIWLILEGISGGHAQLLPHT